ncbi:hypothetical protein METHP15_410009 [Pseudomonas sp. P15-2025]
MCTFFSSAPIRYTLSSRYFDQLIN